MGFQRLCHVISDIDILFEKLKSEKRVEFEKHPLHITPLGLGISCKIFFFNIFSGDLHFDALIKGFF